MGACEIPGIQHCIKKVVVATADQGQMFSSNYLIPNGDNNYQAKYVSAYTGEARNTSTYPVDVFLYNYSTSNLYDYYGETSSRSTTTHTVGINLMIGKQTILPATYFLALRH